MLRQPEASTAWKRCVRKAAAWRFLLFGQIRHDSSAGHPDRNDGSGGDDGVAGPHRVDRERKVRRYRRGFGRSAEGHYRARTHKICDEGRASDSQRSEINRGAASKAPFARRLFARAKAFFMLVNQDVCASSWSKTSVKWRASSRGRCAKIPMRWTWPSLARKQLSLART